MRRQDFSYDLPEELIAQSPLAERSASRLLVLDGATGVVADRGMGDLPGYLRAGDLLVFNDTRVVAARIVGAKPSGGRVEIFLERVISQGQAAGYGHRREALVQLRASKPIRAGLEISTGGGVVRVLGREEELWRVETPGDALEFFEAWGEVPLPPYIHRSADANDRERYQSIFAREKGAVAAPTASLHFDAALVAKLEAMGVGRAFVTLHVGAGTFQPLRTDDLGAHKMHAERVSVSRATWEAVQRTRAAGGRVVAVGTTVVRALESAALEIAGLAMAVEGRESAAGGHGPPGGGNESAALEMADLSAAVGACESAAAGDGPAGGGNEPAALERADLAAAVEGCESAAAGDGPAGRGHESAALEMADLAAAVEGRESAAAGHGPAGGGHESAAPEMVDLSAAVEGCESAAGGDEPADCGNEAAAPGNEPAAGGNREPAIDESDGGSARAADATERALATSQLVRRSALPSRTISTGARDESRSQADNAHWQGHEVRDARAQSAWSGETRLFIRPGFKFNVVDAMVTNFHLPESTLLMLVSAFAGREHVLAAYAHAVRERYRFFSYGDAMFVTPVRPTSTPPKASSISGRL